MRLTERDIAILRWLGRFRHARADQVARRFGMSERMVYRRLQAMAREGYVAHEWRFRGQPGVYLVTRDGLGAAESQLPAGVVDIRTYRHDGLMVDLASRMELEQRTVLTEREIRLAEAGVDKPYSTRLPTKSNPEARHYPDLVLVRPDGLPLAVEVELVPKRGSRLDAIIRSYARARHLSGCLYYVDSEAMQRTVATAIERERAADLVRVEVIV